MEQVDVIVRGEVDIRGWYWEKWTQCTEGKREAEVAVVEVDWMDMERWKYPCRSRESGFMCQWKWRYRW